MAKSGKGGKNLFAQAKTGAKKGVKKGVQTRVQNVVAGTGGGGGGQPFSSGGGEGKKLNLGVVLIIGAVVLLGIIISPAISDSSSSGFLKTRVVDPVRPIFESIGKAFGSFSEQAQRSGRIIRGEEQVFDWGEGDVVNRIKSGVSFENGRDYITSALVEVVDPDDPDKIKLEQGLGPRFGALIDVVVGKLGTELETIPGKIECSIKDVKGIIFNSPSGVMNLQNPGDEDEYKHSDINCVFSGERADEAREILKDRDEDRVYYSGDIVFNLTYSLESSVFLPTFIIKDRADREFYKTYNANPHSAFDNPSFGDYGEYFNGVDSLMEYQTDVVAVMRMSPQPLFIEDETGGSYEFGTFGVQFKNKNRDGKVEINGFGFNLTRGLEIFSSAEINNEGTGYMGGDCEYFEFFKDLDNGRVEYKFKKFLLNEVNTNLNSNRKESLIYLCRVRVVSSIFEGHLPGLHALGDVEAKVDYDSSVSETVRISN